PNELRTFGLAGALHADAWVRARVAELLDPQHRDELRALLRLSGDTSPMVRAAAATMLESAADLDERIAALIDARESDDVVRKSAFTWLVRRGDDAAFQHLIAALERGAEQPDVAQHLEALSLVFPDQSFEKVPHLHERRPMAVVGDAPAKQRRSDNRRASALRSLGQTGLRLSPLVLSGAHGLPAAACSEAYDAGIRSFFWEPKYRELSKFLRSRRLARDSFTVIAGTYFAGAEGIRADVERTLKQLRFDWIDVFLLFWVRSSERVSSEDFGALETLRTEGKIRTFGFSTHDRTICLNALQNASWPVVMTRHSAAHPGAEDKVFPMATACGTGVLTFTATCYGRLLRPTAQTPENSGITLPTAADCYRYSLSQKGVSACLTAPRNRDELFENLEVLDGEKLDPDAMAAIRTHGVAVRAENRRFDTLVRRAPGGPHDRLRELLDES
ncbi:MAG TPA: aldo/keto reductase, partial [Polyangium sp.]|nr:aldo/keto reductase [Polyangium sp.]